MCLCISLIWARQSLFFVLHYFQWFMFLNEVKMKFTNFLLVSTSAVLLTFDAMAQSASMRQELDALKEDVLVLQRQAYREKESAINPASAQSISIRMGEFDETVRQLVGKVDEMEYKIKKLDEKINMVNKDIDLRLKMMEEKGGTTAPAVVKTQSISDAAKASSAGAKNKPGAAGSGVISSGDLPAIKDKTAEDVYQEGLDAIKASNNDLAIQRFNLVLSKFPKHKLAANAQYWIGEAYYAKKDYAKAAVAFAKGYEEYKNGPKGADNILKLGMSMRELGKKEEACTAFVNLPKEFPKAEAPLKNKAKAAAEALNCK